MTERWVVVNLEESPMRFSFWHYSERQAREEAARLARRGSRFAVLKWNEVEPGERERHEGMVSCLAMVLTVIRNYEGADSAVERELRLNLGADLFEAAERENAAHVG